MHLLVGQTFLSAFLLNTNSESALGPNERAATGSNRRRDGHSSGPRGPDYMPGATLSGSRGSAVASTTRPATL